jgi:hypothetical protein
MQEDNVGQPDRVQPPPAAKPVAPPAPAPADPAVVRPRGGLRALTAILIEERKKRSQAGADAPLPGGPSQG